MVRLWTPNPLIAVRFRNSLPKCILCRVIIMVIISDCHSEETGSIPVHGACIVVSPLAAFVKIVNTRTSLTLDDDNRKDDIFGNVSRVGLAAAVLKTEGSERGV